MMAAHRIEPALTKTVYGDGYLLDVSNGQAILQFHWGDAPVLDERMIAKLEERGYKGKAGPFHVSLISASELIQGQIGVANDAG